MNDVVEPTSPARPSRVLRWSLLAVGVVALGGAGAWGWQQWQQQLGAARAQAAQDAVRLQGLSDSVDALRRDQRAASQRLQDAAATNRVLRDEMLGLGQRSALLEENLARLAADSRHDAQALHRDEAELLLMQASQRLDAADDVDGARRLYALAAVALADLPDADGLNLRQALLQERTVIDAAGSGPRAQVLQRLATLDASLQALPEDGERPAAAAADARPWWQVALAPFVEITPTTLSGPLTDAERVQGRDALQLELTLARAAAERGDAPALQQACDRIERWMTRLWPDSPALRSLRAELQAMAKAPLRLAAPELGSTLRQLHSLRDGDTP